MAEIKVTLKRSGIGRNQYFTKVLNGLGLRRLHQTVVLQDTPDPVTTLVVGSVTTTAGTVTVGNGAGDTMVEVAFGDLAVGQIEVVVFDVLVNHNIPSGVTE